MEADLRLGRVILVRRIQQRLQPLDHFAGILDEVRIWERGAGPTLASGSSASAVAWAAVHSGRTGPGRHRVVMPGGDLHVTVRADATLRLAGPVTPVGFFLPVA